MHQELSVENNTIAKSQNAETLYSTFLPWLHSKYSHYQCHKNTQSTRSPLTVYIFDKLEYKSFFIMKLTCNGCVNYLCKKGKTKNVNLFSSPKIEASFKFFSFPVLVAVTVSRQVQVQKCVSFSVMVEIFPSTLILASASLMA